MVDNFNGYFRRFNLTKTARKLITDYKPLTGGGKKEARLDTTPASQNNT